MKLGFLAFFIFLSFLQGISTSDLNTSFTSEDGVLNQTNVQKQEDHGKTCSTFSTSTSDFMFAELVRTPFVVFTHLLVLFNARDISSKHKGHYEVREKC